MTKTTNYQLSQWEPADKISRADFNADNAAIDAAIKAVADTANSKAGAAELAAVSQSVAAHSTSLAALTTDLGSGGTNCRIVTGSYTGTGTYGSSAKNSLTLPFAPKVIFIFPSQAAMELNTYYQGVFGIGLPHAGIMLNTYQYYSGSTLTTLSLSGTKLTWYDSSAELQFNQAAKYYYVAIG